MLDCVTQAQPGKSSAEAAYKALNRALKAYQDLNRNAPYQLFNNWGVLCHR
jgi:flagellar hook-basal body complex protein FliE